MSKPNNSFWRIPGKITYTSGFMFTVVVTYMNKKHSSLGYIITKTQQSGKFLHNHIFQPYIKTFLHTSNVLYACTMAHVDMGQKGM